MGQIELKFIQPSYVFRRSFNRAHFSSSTNLRATPSLLYLGCWNWRERRENSGRATFTTTPDPT